MAAAAVVLDASNSRCRCRCRLSLGNVVIVGASAIVAAMDVCRRLRPDVADIVDAAAGGAGAGATVGATAVAALAADDCGRPCSALSFLPRRGQ